MRMRKKKHSAERIAACAAYLCEKPEITRENPFSSFKNDAAREIRLEIGCGKGRFICEMSKKEPDVDFYAMEKITDVVLLALERAKRDREDDSSLRDNLRFICADAKTVADYFPDGSLDCIYLNFSDPWPKKGYEKRRLTHRAFLDVYKKALRADGVIRLKTDNEKLFDYSLSEFEAAGFETVFSTRNLHSEPSAADNVMTEYEENFSSQGLPIFAATVRKV